MSVDPSALGDTPTDPPTQEVTVEEATPPEGLDATTAESNLQSYYDNAPIDPRTREKVGYDWYDVEHQRVRDVAASGPHPVDPETFTAMVAATSYNNRWDTENGKYPNLATAKTYADISAAYPEVPTEDLVNAPNPGYFRAGKRKAIQLHRGELDKEAVLGPLKFNDFNRALHDPEGNRDAVPLDKWMIRAILHDTKAQGDRNPLYQWLTKEVGYRWGQQRVRNVAARNGKHAQGVQAAIWKQVRGF